MCLILLALRAHPEYPLVIAANRDELYERPTAPAAAWRENPRVLAGRDLVGGGTWLGIETSGRFAAVSNFRDGRTPAPAGAPSRGRLVADYLNGTQTVTDYLDSVRACSPLYDGFNLILGDRTAVYYYGNRAPRPRVLARGVFGVSNHLLDSPWPKLRRAKAGLSRLLARRGPLDLEALFALLADRRIAPDPDLPDTGIPLDRERLLSPIFIESPEYGTRSSTVLTIDRGGRLSLVERSFARGLEHSETRRFEFDRETGSSWVDMNTPMGLIDVRR